MNRPQRIILHHSATDGGTFESIKRYHVHHNGWADIGYHYLITLDGKVHKGRDEKTVGAHTIGQNEKSIGICIVGNYDKTSPDSVVLDSLDTLIKDIFKRRGTMPIEPHSKYAKKTCPGKNFPLEKVIARAVSEEDPFQKLSRQGIIGDPAYWKVHAVQGQECKGEYVRTIIERMAKMLK